MTTLTTTLTGTWVADTVHSDVSFKVRHMAVGKAKGTFALKSATLIVAGDRPGRRHGHRRDRRRQRRHQAGAAQRARQVPRLPGRRAVPDADLRLHRHQELRRRRIRRWSAT